MCLGLFAHGLWFAAASLYESAPWWWTTTMAQEACTLQNINLQYGLITWLVSRSAAILLPHGGYSDVRKRIFDLDLFSILTHIG